MVDWPTVWTAMGGSALVIAAGGWALQTLLTHRLDRANQRAAVRFSSLHEKRAEVLAELYRHLSNIDMVFRSLPAQEQAIDTTEHQQKMDVMLEEMKQAAIYFRNHALYFEPELKQKLDKYLMGTFTFSRITAVVTDTIAQSSKLTEERKQLLRNKLLPGVTDAHRQLGPLLTDLEWEFRKLLGS